MRPAGQGYTVRTGHGDVTARVDLEGRVTVEGHDGLFDIDPVGDGAYLVRDAERTWLVHVTGPADARHVVVDGVAATVEVTATGDRKTRRRHEPGAFAQMPATVVEIVVVPGQTVAAGDILLKLEAMKMEMPVRTPRAGTVRAIRCAEGDLVQPGVELVEIA